MPIIHTTFNQEEAIKMMATLPNAGNLRDISDGWRPAPDSDRWTPERCAAYQLWAFDSHIGLCLRDYERNGYDDSDFYMIVWNESTGKPEEYQFATTRGWTYPSYGSRPDATPEIRGKYDAYMTEVCKRESERHELEQVMTPEIGKQLQVIGGRKVPIGVEGTCIWVGVYHRGFSRWADSALRVGLKTALGDVYWTDAKNVQVV